MIVAKQEAFEEKIKLKNQFRSLDEDEVDFLDSIMESTRAQEAAVKKDTADQLEMFRKQREEAEKALLEDGSANVVPAAEGEDWKIPGRKRRREKKKDSLIPGKKRKSTAEGTGQDSPPTEQKTEGNQLVTKEENNTKPVPAKSGPAAPQKEPYSSLGSNNPVKPAEDAKATNSKPPEPPKPAASLGLADYDSDSE